MKINDLLSLNKYPDDIKLGRDDLINFLWKHKGILKEQERDKAFWEATNENLKIAYENLDEKEQELERAYEIIHEDLTVAHKIQEALLPEMNELMNEELELAVYHKQLAEVGGDYYDFFKTKNDRYAIGVFDISGHGVSASLVMAFLKAQFMLSMENLDSPKSIVEYVNMISYDFLKEVKKYATINFILFNHESLKYVCGGGFGLLIHGKEYHYFNKNNHFLGLRSKPFYESELPFVENDLLALYTDGIIEAQNESGKDYTAGRLNNIIIKNSNYPVKEILQICIDDYHNFKSKYFDDITLLILRKKG